MTAARVRIFTDSCADLAPEMYRQREITVLPLHVHFGDEVYDDGVDLPSDVFYPKLAAAATMPSTSCPSPGEYAGAFRAALDAGCDAVYVGFSSGLSGSVQSAQTAQSTLGDEANRVVIVDTLAASVGQGLLVLRAADLRDQGLSAAEIAATIEAEKMGMYHIFSPDTLDYLHRGGRVSALVAAAAGLLDIKLVMRVDELGHLVPLDKVRGRKRALKRLVEELTAHRVPDAIGGRVGICHSICPDDVATLTETLKRDHGISEVVVGPIGATIGTHTGPGCISLFFAGPQGRRP